MKFRVRSYSTLTLFLALAACGDDEGNPTGITGDALTEAETGALAEVVAGTLFSTFESTEGVPGGAPARATVEGTLQVNAPVLCEFGGSVNVSGDVDFSFDDQTGSGTLDYTVEQDHQDCVAESEGGIRFTLNGSPNISAYFVAAIIGGESLSFDGSYGGAVAWETSEKSGTCPLDVDFEVDGNLVTETFTASIAGMVCGTSFSHDLSIT